MLCKISYNKPLNFFFQLLKQPVTPTPKASGYNHELQKSRHKPSKKSKNGSLADGIFLEVAVFVLANDTKAVPKLLIRFADNLRFEQSTSGLASVFGGFKSKSNFKTTSAIMNGIKKIYNQVVNV